MGINQAVFDSIANPNIVYALPVLGLLALVGVFALPGASQLGRVFALPGTSQLGIEIDLHTNKLTAKEAYVVIILAGICLLTLSASYRLVSYAIVGAIVIVSGILFKILVDERIIDPAWRPFFISLWPFHIEWGVIVTLALVVLLIIFQKIGV